MIRTTITWCALALALSAGVAQAGPDEMRRAAEQGDPEMQLELGILYEYGYGLKQNRVPALAWYTVAAEQGNARAAQKRDALKAHLTTAQIAEAERQAQVLRALIAKNHASPAPTVTDAPAPPAPAQVTVPVSTPAMRAAQPMPAVEGSSAPAPADAAAPTSVAPATSPPPVAPAQPAASAAPTSGPTASSP